MGDVGAGGDMGAGGHGGGNVGTPLGSSSRGGGKWSVVSPTCHRVFLNRRGTDRSVPSTVYIPTVGCCCLSLMAAAIQPKKGRRQKKMWCTEYQ